MSHTGDVITWFGSPDDPSDRAYFRVQRDPDSGVYPDWETEDFESVRHIAGSDANDLFDGGTGPQVLALALEFDSRADYRAFRARCKTTGTLRLVAGFTSMEGAEEHDFSVDYERFADVYLRTPRQVRHHVGGWSECVAEFVLGVTVGGA